MTKRLYLEDLRVGQRLRSASVTITAQDIIRFARDSDPQYFHLDEEAAKDSMFGGLVASGWQTGALSVKLLIDSADPPFAGGLVGVEAHIAWKLPVRPGDSLRVEAEVTRIVHPRRYADRGFVSMDMATYNQRGEVVLTQSVTVVAFRDPARAGESSNDATAIPGSFSGN
ncbi:MAG: MaoC family dehydratase N-terminal domain-containing protein [Methylocystis sp.]|nr:MaoC family dehydratase N-terminal domain-containing protein [Methylocystis sp.]